MDNKLNCITVGDLKKFFENLDDNVPVVSAPFNRDIRTSFGLGIDENGKMGEYTGKIAVFDVTLFDVKSGRKILLVPEGMSEEPEPIKIKYNFNNNFDVRNIFVNKENDIIEDNVVKDEQGND